jgi:hypothetical protein
MSDTRETLRRGIGDFGPGPDAYRRVLERRARKERNRRIAAFAVVALIALAGALAVAEQFRAEPTPFDDDPRPGRSSNGAVVFSAAFLEATNAEADVSWKDTLSGPRDLFLSSPGAEPVRIVGEPGDEVDQGCPAFSSDGRQLAYVERAGSRASLVVADVDADGTPIGIPMKDFGGHNLSCPRWSPTDDRLAIRADDRLAIVDASGGWWSMPADVRSFRWSPDGSALVLVYADVWSAGAGRTAVRAPSRVEVMTVDGGRSDIAWTGGPDDEPTSVAWASDGTALVVAGTRHLEQRNQCCDGDAPFLDIVRRDGYSKTSLPIEGDPAGDSVDDVAWLSDGRMLVSLHATDSTTIVDPLGSVPTRVIDARGFVSPDEAWLIRIASEAGTRFAVVAEPMEGGAPVYYSPWTLGLYSNYGDIAWQSIPVLDQPASIEASVPTAAAQVHDWPSGNRNPPGLYSWDDVPEPLTGIEGFIHNGYKSSDVQITVATLPELMVPAEGATPDVVAGHDGLYYRAGRNREEWFVRIEGHWIVIGVTWGRYSSPVALADAEAIVASMRTEPRDNALGFRLVFTLTNNDWDSG